MAENLTIRKIGVKFYYILLYTFIKKYIFQVSYAIGVAEPLSITVFDYGTSKLSQSQLLAIVNKNFDLRPGKIVKELNLRNPIYQQTSTYTYI